MISSTANKSDPTKTEAAVAPVIPAPMTATRGFDVGDVDIFLAVLFARRDDACVLIVALDIVGKLAITSASFLIRASYEYLLSHRMTTSGRGMLYEFTEKKLGD